MDLRAWNDKLVDAVFYDHSGASTRIRRIDATDAFLRRVGEYEDEHAARRSFLDAFPRIPGKLRGLFDDLVLAGWSPDSGRLPFYAQLHLTVLAASADEEVVDEGNFRRRLAKMLRMADADYVSRGCLPKLWRRASEWSDRRSRKHWDARRLVLPDPGHETIIGYSKRLAFPAFRDQCRLAEIMTGEHVDASSPITELVGVLTEPHNLGKFSKLFQEEFWEFRKLVSRGDLPGAADTPFWEVVSETNWQIAPSRSFQREEEWRLEIDPTDPFDLGLRVHHQAGHGSVPNWEVEPGATLDALRTGWRRRTNVSMGDRLGRSLDQGCIGFVEDDDGGWFQAAAFPPCGPVWLILLHRVHGSLLDVPTGSGRSYEVPLAGSDHWTLLGPIESNASVRRWLDEHARGLDFFAPRIVAARISIIDSPRTADGSHLYLPPAVPIFRCEGAVSAKATIERGGDEMHLSLRRTNAGLSLEGELYTGDDEVYSARITALDAASNPIARTRIRLRTRSGTKTLKPIRDPTAWLESGAGGRLTDIASWVLPESGEGAEPSESRATGESRLLVRSSVSTPEPAFVEMDRFDARWFTATEILAAIFGRRYALRLGEAFELFGRIWGKELAWKRLDDFVENGHLRLVHARRWSNRIFVPGQPVIVVPRSSSNGTIRVIGLTSDEMRRMHLSRVGHSCRAITSPDGTTVGPIWIDGCSDEDLQRLSAETEWPVVSLDSVPAPVLAPLSSILDSSLRTDLEGVEPLEKWVWNHARGKFVSEPVGEAEIPRLEMWTFRHTRNMFVLYRRNGATWNTDCRRWASLAISAEMSQSIGAVLTDGSLLLDGGNTSMPISIGRYALASGGISYRSDAGQRIYAASESWAPSTACEAWIPRPTLSSTKQEQGPLSAKARYLLLIDRKMRSSPRS